MIGKLKNGYFVDPASGLAFKLNLITMASLGNNMDKLNPEVDRIGGLCKNEAKQCLPTLGILQSVWEIAKRDFPKIASTIASKTRCFIYLPKEIANPEDTALPYGFEEMGFVWNGTNEKVYTPHDINALGYRFKVIQESQIPESPTGETSTNGGTTTSGFIHMQCPFCKKTIF